MLNDPEKSDDPPTDSERIRSVVEKAYDVIEQTKLTLTQSERVLAHARAATLVDGGPANATNDAADDIDAAEEKAPPE